MTADLDILYRDHLLVAVNKPAGLLVHPSRMDRHERRSAMHLLRDRLGRWVYPVHRLDKPTSGVLLFALSAEVARRVTEGFEQQRVGKRYLAVVRGYTEPEGLIDHPIRDEPDPLTHPFARRDKAPRPARTGYRRLATVELPYPVDPFPTSRYSLLELRPLSGRRHQIRRHLKHIAHPVVGDTTHGKTAHNRLFREYLQCPRLLLAATELEFVHPESGRPCRITAPLQGDFAALVERLGWRQAVPRDWIERGS